MAEEEVQPVRPASLPVEIVKRREAMTLYQIAVLALAVLSVIGVLGVFVLAWAGREAPGGIWTVVGLCVGGLVAMVDGDRSQEGGG